MSRRSEVVCIADRELDVTMAERCVEHAAEEWLDSHARGDERVAMKHLETVLEEQLSELRRANSKLAKTRRRLEKRQAKEARA